MDVTSPETENLITSFTEITCSSREVAKSFLKIHQWNLNAAILTFTENEGTFAAETNVFSNPNSGELLRRKRTRSSSPSSSDDDSSGYSSSPSDPCRFRHIPLRPGEDPIVRRMINIRRYRREICKFGDFSDETQEYYVEGESSEILVQDPEKANDVDDMAMESYGTDRESDEAQEEYDEGENNEMLVEDPENAKDVDDIATESYGTDRDSDEAQEFYDEGENSEILVEDPEKAKDVDDKARESATESFGESIRSMSNETVTSKLQNQPHGVVISTVTIWRNGYTVDDSRLKSFNNPENVAFVEYITSLKSPRVLSPFCVQVKLIRRDENFTEQESQTLVGSESAYTEPPLTTTQPPSMGLLVVDPEAPTTLIQLRLADGTRLVTQFNTHHTVRDVQSFIDAFRPDDSKDYQLLIMGFPPTPLFDFDQTIEKAGIANSVLIQKF